MHGRSMAATAMKDVQGVADVLKAANDEMADYLRGHTTKLLNDVLYTSSNLMHTASRCPTVGPSRKTSAGR